MAVITAGRKFDMHMAKRKNHERGPNHIGNKKRQAEKPAIIVLRTFYVDTKIWKFKKGESK